MRRRDFEKFYKRYAPSIRAIARKLAQRDDELVQDLEQEGALALLLLNPARATTNPDAWIRQALKNRMVDYLRKLKLQKYDSLDGRLDNGDQVEQLPNGELTLRSSRSPIVVRTRDEDDE